MKENKKKQISRHIVIKKSYFVLFLLLIIISFISISTGPSEISILKIIKKIFLRISLSEIEYLVLIDIRIPRLFMGILVGSSLAVSGTIMQGLFRNPLADPGIVGVGAGASLGAIIAIVLINKLPIFLTAFLGDYLIVFFAFFGGWITTFLLYIISTKRGETSVSTMILAGIAIGALAGAITGLLIYLADDTQLRDLTFWGLGSLNGATWIKVYFLCPFILISIFISLFLGGSLNALSLGETTAKHIGISTKKLKNISIIIVAASTGSAVAFSGGIGFIGIIVPHLIRQIQGPDHRFLIFNSALLGAIILICSDMISRIIVQPSELPIGIVTALIGSPVFLWILFNFKSMKVW